MEKDLKICRVLDTSADLWNNYLKLDNRNEDEDRVIRDSIHTIQALMAIRIIKNMKESELHHFY